MTDTELLEKILYDILHDAGVKAPTEKFPLILREGKNDFGKTVRFYLNYSAAKQDVNYRFPDGTDILNGKEIRNQAVFEMEPWGVRVIEEK